MPHDPFPAAAEHCAAVVLDNLSRTYPYAAHHIQVSDDDRPTPSELHPAFDTSFDWHSCVHMHWLGVSVLNAAHNTAARISADDGGAHLEPPTAARLRAALADNLTAEKLAVEAEYLAANPSWERPYGWAWLVRLAAACAASGDDEIRGWGRNLEGCVDVVARLVRAWLAKAEYPVRHGLHTNSAFGVALLLDAFRALGRTDAAEACEAAARAWFGADARWASEWELSGQDFLSAGLSEADLMQRVLGADEFAAWFGRFLPGLRADSRMLAVVGVTDESDGYMVHLHGLNLSRAGQLARVVRALRAAAAPSTTPAAEPLLAAAAPSSVSSAEPVLAAALEPLLKAGLAALDSEDFMSTHWLASFAWDALESRRALQPA
ncbi:DUF2891 family protein [Sinomonas sp. ASV322]|uniref:DUF2891 family protein n=1 Tax=Sinomonas sp. ASV322 TaxID=3041920 RepID=UPI0027DB010B|nr:DUF2891 family protein [Sinomonas sp. ASV322]MDQ4502568.1 DUF2891 family protein [Sinomonas sp. ASV322]